MRSLLIAARASTALVACNENGTDVNTANSTATPANEAAAAPSAQNEGLPFTVTPIADFDAPWAMTFLPDGRMLVTEKDGRMLLVSADGQTWQREWERLERPRRVRFTLILESGTLLQAEVVPGVEAGRW